MHGVGCRRWNACTHDILDILYSLDNGTGVAAAENADGVA
jgi:hypothetical protein